MSVSKTWGRRDKKKTNPNPTQKKPHCIFTSTSSRLFPRGCIPRGSSRRCHSRGQSQQAALLLPPPVGDCAGADRVTKPVCFVGECWHQRVRTFSQVTRAQDYLQQQRLSRNSTYSSLTQTVNTALISNRDKRRAKAGNRQQRCFTKQDIWSRFMQIQCLVPLSGDGFRTCSHSLDRDRAVLSCSREVPTVRRCELPSSPLPAANLLAGQPA